MKILNCSVAMKVAISSFISLALVIFTALWTYYVSNEVHSLAVIAKKDGVVFAQTAQQMEKDVIQIQQWLTDVSATRGQNNLNDGFERAERSYQSFLAGLSIFEKQYGEVNDKARLEELSRIRQLLDEYYILGKQMAEAYVEHGPAEGNKSMKRFDEQAEILSASLKPFITYHYNRWINELESVSDTMSLLMKGELIVFVLIAISVITSAIIILRLIMTNMRRSQSIIEKLARGELTGELNMEAGKDEMGKLMGALGDLYQRLQDIVGEVNRSSDEIRNTAYDISLDNVNLSEMTAKQSGGLHEVTDSLNTITESVLQNAKNAEKANELAAEATEVAREGALAITITIGSMGQVDASSKKISEITAVIDSIAFQTNLLALNASVEAARAGEGGKGFAVVANEVRNLAQRSAGSAKEIKFLIEESVERVDDFSRQIDASAEALSEIVGAIREVSEVVSKIAQANIEQSRLILGVNQGIIEMNKMTDSNQRVAMETANYSNKLKGQADRLNNIMRFFKVADKG